MHPLLKLSIVALALLAQVSAHAAPEIEINVDLSAFDDTAPMQKLCAELLTAPRFTAPLRTQQQLGHFRVVKSIDVKRQRATIDVSMSFAQRFTWNSKTYEVPTIDLHLIDTEDMHDLLAEVYGADYANHADYSGPAQVEVVGRGGFRNVVRSPLSPHRVLKLSSNVRIDLSDAELLGLVVDHLRATFVPRVLADYFDPHGIDVAIPDAPSGRPGATKGAAAALEQKEVRDAKMLRDFLPEFYEAHGGKFPVGKFPHLEQQLRALNMNRNLGLFGLPDAIRGNVERAVPEYVLRSEIPVETTRGELNPLERLDRELMRDTERYISKDNVMTAPRLVFDAQGLPMVRRDAKGKLVAVTQRSRFGADLNPRNVLVKEIRRQDTGEIYDYQLTIIDN